MPRKNLRTSATKRSAEQYLPEKASLKTLREAADHCRGCDLYRDATQTVFGRGSARARLMFVGEQPGDSEDKQGRPFVGPAGKVLHTAFSRAGIDERDVYTTNAVKHFKYIWRGKRRIHAKPKRIEVRACMPWLEKEIDVVRPEIVVALGATAAQALLGPGFRLTAHRGEFFSTELAPRVTATTHPSSVLRAPDAAARRAAMAEFVSDLKAIAKELKRSR